MSRLLSWGESQMMTPNLEDLSVSPSVRHGHSIPGGLTDMGITGTDTDCPFCTRGRIDTCIHQTHTREGRFSYTL